MDRFLDDLDAYSARFDPYATQPPAQPEPMAPPPAPLPKPPVATPTIDMLASMTPSEAPPAPMPAPEPAAPPAPMAKPAIQRIQVENDTLEFPAGMSDQEIEAAILDAYPHLNPRNAQGVYTQIDRSVTTGITGGGAELMKGAGAVAAGGNQSATRFSQALHDYAQADPAGRAAIRQGLATNQAIHPQQRESLSLQFDDIDQGAPPEMFPAPPPAATVEGNPLYQAGERVQKWGERTFPVAPADRQKWYNQLSNGVGSTLALVGPALVPGAGPALGFMSAGLAGAGEAADRAIEAGATEDEIVQATYAGLGPGAIDYLSIDRLLRPITRNPGVRGFLVGMAKKAAEQAGIEGTTEAIQQVLQNWIAQGLYKPNQDLTEDVLQNFLLGAGVGGLFGGAAGVRARVRTQEPPPAATPVSPAVEPAPAPPESTGGALPPPAPGLPPPETVYGDGFTMNEPAPPPPGPPQLPAPPVVYGDGFTMERQGQETVGGVPGEYPAADQPVTATDVVPPAPMPAPAPPDPQVEAARQAQQIRDILAAPEATVAEVMQRQGREAATAAGLPDTGATVRFTLPELNGGEQTAQVASYGRDAQGRDTVILTDPETGDDVYDGPWSDLEIRAINGRGTRAEPVKIETARDMAPAVEQVATPTPAQAEAGNYRKGHLQWNGLDIAIETAKGAERSGVGKDGKPWSVTMPEHYGYVKRTNGADGDQVDVYMGPNPEAKEVYLIDQIDPDTRKFDEHKVMIGFPSREAAQEAYFAAFSDKLGGARMGSAFPMSIFQFKQWLRNGDTKKPIVYREPDRAKKGPTPQLVKTPRAAHEFKVVGKDGQGRTIFENSRGERSVAGETAQPQSAKEAPIVAFRREASEIEKKAPNVPQGHVRLWRGNRPGEVGTATRFTNSLAGIALPFRKAYGGDLSYVDVPVEVARQYTNTGVAATGAEFTLPTEWAARAQVFGQEPGARNPEAAASPSVKPKRRPPVRRDFNIAHWLSRRGGMYDPGGDLASMGGDAWHRKYPGFGKLIRPGGTAEQASIGGVSRETKYDPDIVAQAAIEEGYLPEGAGPRELLDAIGEAIAGRGGRTVEDVEAQGRREEQDRADAINKAYDEIRRINAAEDVGLTDDQMETAAIMAVDMNLDPVEAAQEVAIDTALAWEAQRAESRTDGDEGPAAEPEDIPFDAPPAPDAGGGAGDRGSRSSDGGQAGRQEGTAPRPVPGEPGGEAAEPAGAAAGSPDGQPVRKSRARRRVDPLGFLPDTDFRPDDSNDVTDAFRSYATEARGSQHIAAEAFVKAFGGKAGFEFGVAVATDGRSTRAWTNGRRSGLDFPAGMVDTDSYVIHHNHPSGTPLSTSDVAALAKPGIAVVVEHGQYGSSLAVLTDAARRDLEANGRTADDRQRAVYETIRVIDRAVYRALNVDVQARRVEPNDASLYHREIINIAADALGLIHYRSTRAPQEAMDARRLADIFDIAYRAGREHIDKTPDGLTPKAAKEAKDAIANSRRTTSVRPDQFVGELESLAGGIGEEDAGRRGRADGTAERGGDVAPQAAGPAIDRTDQGDQTVLPGAERISDRDLAQRKMEGAKQAPKPQKAPDEGLFDSGAQKQTDLVDMLRSEPKPAADTKTSVDALIRKIEEIDKALMLQLGADLRAKLNAMGLKDVGLTVEKVITLDGIPLQRGQVIQGFYDDIINTIGIATEAGRPQQTLSHEAIHAMRALGLFTGGEWRALERAALADRALMADVRDRYATQGLPEDKMVEEAIADMYAAWDTGRRQWGGLIGRAFTKIRNFIRALREVITGREDYRRIFEKIASGEVGARERKPRGKGGTSLAAAWHGSPHDFDEFTTAKMGTGEGAQAYGWGLYFAGRQEVADWYKRKLAQPAGSATYKGHTIAKGDGKPLIVNEDWQVDLKRFLELAVDEGLSAKELIAKIDTEMTKPGIRGFFKAALSKYSFDSRFIDFLQKKNVKIQREGGRLYEVDLAPAEDEYLLWDKPLSEQSEKVTRFLGNWMPKNIWDAIDSALDDRGQNPMSDEWSSYTGREFYRALTHWAVNEALPAEVPGSSWFDGKTSEKQHASLWLRSHGIRGIKYLDGASRSKGEGAYNYVIFDDKDVTITRKYSIGRDLMGMPLTSFDRSASEWLADRNLTRLQRMTGALKAGARRAQLEVQDYFLPVKLTERAVERATGAPLPDDQKIYRAESLFHGIVERKFDDFADTRVQPLVDALRNENITVARLDEYLYARHAVERNEKIARINPEMPDGGSGMTTAEANRIMASFDPHEMESLRRLADMVDRINRERLDTLVEGGLLSPAQRAAWDATYEHYVPLRGMAGETDPDWGDNLPRAGRNFDIRGKESSEAIGRMTKAGDITATILAQAEEAILRAEKNKVGQSFLRFVRANPSPDLWTVDRIAHKRRINKSTGQVQWYADNLSPTMGPNILAVKEDGTVHFIDIKNPMLARALNEGPARANGIVALLGKLTRWHAALVTRWNPAFTIPNLLRDITEAMINVQQFDKKGMARAIARDVGPALRGAFGGARGKRDTVWQRAWDEYTASGGKVGMVKLLDVEGQQKRILGMLRASRPGTLAAGERIARGTFEYLGDINDAVENAVRLATFKNLRDRGVSAPDAAMVARNITVDFNRRGRQAWLGMLYLFFNAGVQGGATAFRAMRSRKVQGIVAGLVASGVALDLLNAAMSGNDDDDDTPVYDKLGDFDKQRNLVIMNPWAKGKEDLFALKMPISRAYSPFLYMGISISEVLRGKTDPVKAATNAVTAFLDAYNPMGTHPSLFVTTLPEAWRPVAEVIANKNFAGNPIKPPAEKIGGGKRPEAERHFRNVDPLAKAITTWLNEHSGGSSSRSGWLDFSPEDIEHIAGWGGGGVSRFFLDLNKSPGNISDALDGNVGALSRLPIVKSFLSGERQGWASTEFYRIKEEARLASDEIKAFRKAGRDTDADKVRERYGPELSVARQIQRISKANSRDRKAIDALKADENLTADQRDLAVKQVEDQIDARLREVIRAYNAAKKSAKAN